MPQPEAKPQTLPPLDAPSTQEVGYPTTWLTQEEFEKYIPPLYSRGWGIRYMYPNKQFCGCNTGELFVRYQFSSYASALEFVQSMGRVAITEMHHPRLLCANYTKHVSVALHTLTNWAKRDPGKEIEPGITIRDIRLAILADAHYTKNYAAKVKDRRRLASLVCKPRWEDYVRHLDWIKGAHKGGRSPQSTKGQKSDIGKLLQTLHSTRESTLYKLFQ